jgi:hypothetical protein
MDVKLRLLHQRRQNLEGIEIYMRVSWLVFIVFPIKITLKDSRLLHKVEIYVLY